MFVPEHLFIRSLAKWKRDSRTGKRDQSVLGQAQDSGGF